MRSRGVYIAVSVFLAMIAIIYYWKASQPPATGMVEELSGILRPLFYKHGLVDSNQTRKAVEERRSWLARYVHAYLEYDLPASFSDKDFESGMRRSLEKTKFRVARTDRAVFKKADTSTFTIRRGTLDVLTLKINRRKAAVIPRPEKRFKNPKVAIVIDDMGYSLNNAETIFGMKKPFTVSVLPGLKFSARVSGLARENGCDVMLHLPLEPQRKDLTPEPGEINSKLSEKEILARLDSAIKSVPGIKGASNHEGSKSTEDVALMTIIMGDLKRRGLFFFDSMTSQNSVCKTVAKTTGTRFAKRDIFLDNQGDVEYIKRQFAALSRFAFKNGRAIAICHDRKNTAAVLAEMVPLLAGDGIEFVRISEFVK